MSRFEIDPDPAWDLAEEEEGGVLAVELSWEPDALAGRPPELVATPVLVTALSDAGLTGFRTGLARGYYGEGAFGVEEGQTPPDLVRLVVEETPEADFSYERSQGLTVSERALALLQEHCQNLTIK
ncbi:hypothetical protein JIG36_04285 [Actinoplanes sp. LDG1-06]|uniref:Uncharacterized protein n=1 Tax=Paractinoplanes ovalisporus TaxID=2810368 RepID=A0ABS2A4J9_9ACTN|nr:hypothetical protein [Actinoplanes ovalisporus]MBM2614773.1 hypothetical protein [Actinoplanes ovalisporus]